MIKRALLAFTLAVAGLGIGSKAMAWSDCNTGAGYASPTTYAVGYAGYPPYVAPRVAYYPPVPVRSYPVFYGRAWDGHHHHHDHRNGLTVSFGF
jgi:hypothetical protein